MSFAEEILPSASDAATILNPNEPESIQSWLKFALTLSFTSECVLFFEQRIQACNRMFLLLLQYGKFVFQFAEHFHPVIRFTMSCLFVHFPFFTISHRPVSCSSFQSQSVAEVCELIPCPIFPLNLRSTATPLYQT
jgi:hypothetical protein